MSPKTTPKSLKKHSILERFNMLESLLKVLETDSCLQIYSYLILFGQTTPAKLREVTGQSKATIFRNLAVLYETEVLDKVEDPDAEDKRYNLYYYVNQDILQLVRKLYSTELDEYAGVSNQQDVINRWTNAVEALPLALSQFTNHFIMLSASTESTQNDGRCMAVAKILSFRVGETDDLGNLITQISNLVKTFESRKKREKRDFKEPLNQPVAMSISLTFPSPEGSIPFEGAASMYKECDD
jgi:DNA-binding transcriptional ArsR family regulator